MVGWVLAGCAASPGGADDEGTGASGLPVVALDADVDGPVGLRDAATAADVAVLGRVAEIVPGARFHGGGDAEDIYDGTWFEDVEFVVEVDRALLGAPGDTVVVRMAAYRTDTADSDSRVAALDLSGLVPAALEVGDRGLFLIEEHGPPWGPRLVGSTSGFAQLVDGSAAGVVQGGLRDVEGRSVDEIVEVVEGAGRSG